MMDIEENDDERMVKVKSREGKVFEATLAQLKMCGKKKVLVS